MSKEKKDNEHVTTRKGSAYPLRLAVAAVTLGMSMGINPSEVLATQQQVEQENKEITLAASDKAKLSDIKGKGGVEKPGGGATGLKPGVAYPKVEQPGAAYPKVERPGAAFPKVEQPGVAHPKLER